MLAMATACHSIPHRAMCGSKSAKMGWITVHGHRKSLLPMETSGPSPCHQPLKLASISHVSSCLRESLIPTILALHPILQPIFHFGYSLHSTGAPQFYPFCAQLNIHGTGSSVPTSSELVSIPGVYDNAGDAIYGDIWQNPTTWTIAGPSPVPFAVGSSNNGGTVTQTGTAQPTNTGTPMQSPNPVTKSGKCKAKKRNTSLVKRAVFDQVKGSHVKLRRSRGMFWLW